MAYTWDFGDGATATTRDVTYSYKTPGIYRVVMTVNSNAVCADSTILTINVYPNIMAEFSISPVCIDLPVLPVNNTVDPGTSTVNYLWDLGNGQTSVQRNPPPQVYPNAGEYIMSLSVSTAQCPFPLSIQKRFVTVDAPTPAINNPEQIAVANFPLTLQARAIGNNALWTPSLNLDNPASYTPVFIGNKEQLYTIELKTISGCITVDTQIVKINKRIEIYVPNSFTPNNDGKNDFLRPYMIGIKELRFFRIFNRWGQLIFETKDTAKGWDGTQQSAHAEIQTLVWMLEGIGVDNKVYKAKGTTVLIR